MSEPDSFEAMFEAVLNKLYVLNRDRYDLIRRLKDYKADPYVLENDAPFEGGVVDFCALRAIIMWPETGWTADEFIDRLLYLLGDTNAD